MGKQRSNSTKNPFNLQVICDKIEKVKINKIILMGKKANVKKGSKEINKPQSKPHPKREIKKELLKIKEHLKLKVNKQAIFGGALVLIMLSLLVAVGVLLFSKAFKPESIAKILPEKNVIAILEINSNFEHNQIIKAMDLLKNYPEYSKENLLKLVETKFNVSYENDLKKWMGRSMGTAFLTSDKEAGGINQFYFAEISGKENIKKFLSKEPKINYGGYEIYAMKQPLYAVSIDDYLIVSQKEEAIYELIDSLQGTRLYYGDKYRRIDDNMPINKTAFLYIDFEKINNGFIKNFPVLSEKGLSIESLTPFFKIFKAEGFSLIALNDNFVIQSFLSLNPENLEDSQYILFKEKYNAGLTKYVATDALAFWGGKNLEYQLKRMVEVVSGGNEDAMIFINAFIQNYSQKYFGSDISFNEDILPLLENEFALGVESIDGKNIYKVLLQLADTENDELMLQDIAKRFAENGGIFDPKIIERKLPDGTVTKEIVAVPESIEKIDSTYKDVIIHGLKIGEREWGIYYAIIGDIAVIATNIDGVKSSIDTDKGDKNSLKDTAIFDYQIAPILESSDEITYFNFKKLFPLLLDENSLNQYLKPIESFSSGKNYFNDGIVTINYLHID